MDRREYLYQRRNRCVGRILGELESIIPEEMMPDIRRAVRTRMSEYHTDVLEVIDLETETKFNALAVKVRDRIANQD